MPDNPKEAVQPLHERVPNDDRMEAALEAALGHVVGDREPSREEFRKILSDAPGILKRICRWAENRSKRSRFGFPPEQFISQITYYGSGVSKAIYELYRGRL